ncbi:hypothetical protein HON59_02485 [bacterium]|nr:hypothetical protein [bacterium]
MRRWIRFFLGSPRRAVVKLSFLAILGVIHYFAPGTLSTIANGVVGELSPLLSMLFYYGLVFFFIFLGFRTMFRPFKKGKGARR